VVNTGMHGLISGHRDLQFKRILNSASLTELKELMDEDTIFISSSHSLIALIRNFEFDTIYHEHLRYYTMHSLIGVLERHSLHMFDGELTDFYGGSILGYSKLKSLPHT